jgi:hypothetical protein
VMAKNEEDRGVQVHMLRSLRAGGGAYGLCNHIVTDERYTLFWELVTCGNCLRCRKTEGKGGDDAQFSQ